MQKLLTVVDKLHNFYGIGWVWPKSRT